MKGKSSNKNWRCASARYVPESGCAEVCISDADLQAILIRAINMQCQLRDARLETFQRQFESHASKRRAINVRMQRVQAEIRRKQEELMSLYEEHVGGQLSKESFTEKRESLLRAQNEKSSSLPGWKAIGNYSARRRRPPKRKDGKPPSSLRAMK